MIRLTLSMLLLAAAVPVLARTDPGIGAQKSCVYLPRVTNQRVDDDGVTLKEGGRWYRMDAGSACTIKSGRSFSSRTPTGSLCRGDIISIFDSLSHTEYGSCGVEGFTQIPRPAPAH